MGTNRKRSNIEGKKLNSSIRACYGGALIVMVDQFVYPKTQLREVWILFCILTRHRIFLVYPCFNILIKCSNLTSMPAIETKRQNANINPKPLFMHEFKVIIFRAKLRLWISRNYELRRLKKYLFVF